MTLLTKQGHGFAGRSSRRDRLEYRLVWSLCFVTYLIAALFRRTANRPYGGSNKNVAQREPILAEARAAAHAAAGYAFMS